VKANSDDLTSRDKDGDFATLRRNDNIPDAIRSAVFALKPDEITDPVRQPNGFYIFKATDVSYRPLSEVRDELYNDLKMQHHRDWLDKTRVETKVQIVNEAFFNAPAAAPVTAGK
jgi:parvulin-like peptidyl-prolyl isomerase